MAITLRCKNVASYTKQQEYASKGINSTLNVNILNSSSYASMLTAPNISEYTCIIPLLTTSDTKPGESNCCCEVHAPEYDVQFRGLVSR
jgi:hypothetical protein